MNLLFVIIHFCTLCISANDRDALQSSCLMEIPTDTDRILANINKFYSDHDYISHELTYELYADFNSTIPVSVERGIFIKDGSSQYAQLLPVESLTTEEFTIGIDHDEKIIMVSNHVSLPATGPMVDVTNWLTPVADIRIHRFSENYSDFIIIMDQGEVQEAAIRYDNMTYQIKKIVLKYRRTIQLSTTEDSPFVQPRLEIDYEKTSLSMEHKPKISINTFVIQSGNEWRPSPKYRDYKVINNINRIGVNP